MSSTVRVRQLGEWSTEFTGESRDHNRVIAATLTQLGAKYHRSATGRGWRVHSAWVDDAMASLEADGHRIEVTL